MAELPSEPVPADARSAATPSVPEPAPANPRPAIGPGNSNKSATISIGELLQEQRHKRHQWMALGMAAHSAAAFDAWSTRHAITTVGAQELNPLYKPFANNGSIYAVIQAGPTVMDYVAKRMMYSRHDIVRKTWWLPQSLSMVSSLACGGHNLTVR
jgi:hypothetical protein